MIIIYKWAVYSAHFLLLKKALQKGLIIFFVYKREYRRNHDQKNNRLITDSFAFSRMWW